MSKTSVKRHDQQDFSSNLPILSVITITLNDRQGLHDTVSSVMEQSYEVPIEHIIVDGLSGYDVRALLDGLESPAHLISERDKGLYDAMNKGIRLATGQYIIFLNSGDLFADEKVVFRIRQAIETEGADLIYGDSLERQIDGSIIYKKSRSIRTLPLGMVTHHQSMVFRRSLLIEYDIYHDLSYRIAADYEFCLRFLRVARRVSYLPVAIAAFQSGGLSQTRPEEGRREQYLVRQHHYGSHFFAWAVGNAQSVIWRLRQRAPGLYWLFRRGF